MSGLLRGIALGGNVTNLLTRIRTTTRATRPQAIRMMVWSLSQLKTLVWAEHLPREQLDHPLIKAANQIDHLFKATYRIDQSEVWSRRQRSVASN